MDAYHKALDMIGRMRLDLKSVRLDKYYSGQSILEDFNENTRIFIIPKSNSRISGKKVWREYFKRNASESGFSSGKRTTGGLI
ncbi:MAG: hypothetical protein QXQ46_06775 [Thermoplasmatales archaeon]